MCPSFPGLIGRRGRESSAWYPYPCSQPISLSPRQRAGSFYDRTCWHRIRHVKSPVQSPIRPPFPLCPLEKRLLENGQEPACAELVESLLQGIRREFCHDLKGKVTYRHLTLSLVLLDEDDDIFPHCDNHFYPYTRLHPRTRLR